jgi:hypothetical protein
MKAAFSSSAAAIKMKLLYLIFILLFSSFVLVILQSIPASAVSFGVAPGSLTLSTGQPQGLIILFNQNSKSVPYSLQYNQSLFSVNPVRGVISPGQTQQVAVEAKTPIASVSDSSVYILFQPQDNQIVRPGFSVHVHVEPSVSSQALSSHPYTPQNKLKEILTSSQITTSSPTRSNTVIKTALKTATSRTIGEYIVIITLVALSIYLYFRIGKNGAAM